MRQALSYIKERDELQEKLRELQIRYDDQYNQLKELQQRSASKPHVLISLNPLPDNNFLDWSKLKRIADDILNKK